MEYNEHRNNGVGDRESGSLSNTSSSSDLNNNNHNSSNSNSIPLSNSYSNNQHRHHNNTTNNNPRPDSDDPMQSWWESVSKARLKIKTLISLLPSSDELDSLSDSDRPGRSLLESHAAYMAVSDSITGSGEDPLCQWMYDTFQQSEEDGSDMRLVVMSWVPLIAGVYLSRVHSLSTTSPTQGTPSLAGFEAVLLSIYSSQTKVRAGRPMLVSVPTPAYLAQCPSLYHSSSSPTPGIGAGAGVGVGVGGIEVGVMCPPLEPQVGVKSTKRGSIVGVALQCFYTHISQMPSWSKIELCRFAASWAGSPCPCPIFSPEVELPGQITVVQDENDDEQDGVRIPLPWELLQPILRILGHCVMAPMPLISEDIKDAASVAVIRLCARASHDLCPQGILATRALVQLLARDQADAFADISSNATTPTSMSKLPEMLLVSQ